MDLILIVLVIAIILVGLYFKDFKSVVYFLGIIDIFFHLVHRFLGLISIEFITNFVEEYIPTSLESIINYYSSGILNTLLIWVLFFLYVYFEIYLIKYWKNKRK